jgi:hypothetical protein
MGYNYAMMIVTILLNIPGRFPAEMKRATRALIRLILDTASDLVRHINMLSHLFSLFSRAIDLVRHTKSAVQHTRKVLGGQATGDPRYHISYSTRQ